MNWHLFCKETHRESSSAHAWFRNKQLLSINNQKRIARQRDKQSEYQTIMKPNLT